MWTSEVLVVIKAWYLLIEINTRHAKGGAETSGEFIKSDNVIFLDWLYRRPFPVLALPI